MFSKHFRVNVPLNEFLIQSFSKKSVFFLSFSISIKVSSLFPKPKYHVVILGSSLFFRLHIQSPHWSFWLYLQNPIFTILYFYHSGSKQPLGFNCFYFFKILFIYSWETHRERQRQAEGEAGSWRGVLCGTRSQDPGITTWTEGRSSTIEPLRRPTSATLKTQYFYFKIWACPQNSYLLTHIIWPPKMTLLLPAPRRARWKKSDYNYGGIIIQ